MPADLTDLIKTSLIKEMEAQRDAVRELAAPLTEKQFWTKPLEPGNSFGHLVLHLTGNVSWFVGAQVGQTGYVREREREFTEGNPPAKADAMTRLDEAVGVFHRVVQGLTAEQLAAPHPAERFGSVLSALVFVTAHFAVHRGQMSYLARLVRNTVQ